MRSTGGWPARRIGFWISTALATVGLLLVGAAAVAGGVWLTTPHPTAACGCPSTPGSNSTPCPLACTQPTAPWILWVVGAIGAIAFTGGLAGVVLLRREPLPLPP